MDAVTLLNTVIKIFIARKERRVLKTVFQTEIKCCSRQDMLKQNFSFKVSVQDKS